MRVLITGGSRGIGSAVARSVARRYPGSKITLMSRSFSEPRHSALQGTLLETARDVEKLGSVALPIEVDMRDTHTLSEAIQKSISAFGGLDILVNNASALCMDATPKARKIALVTDVNVRGTLVATMACENALRESNGSVVTVSPPIDMRRCDWIADRIPYTVSKYSMTLATLGMAARGIRSNCIWPRHTVRTAATALIERSGVPGAHSLGRDPDEFAEALVQLAESDRTGETLFDDELGLDMRHCDAPLDLYTPSFPYPH